MGLNRWDVLALAARGVTCLVIAVAVVLGLIYGSPTQTINVDHQYEWPAKAHHVVARP